MMITVEKVGDAYKTAVVEIVPWRRRRDRRSRV